MNIADHDVELNLSIITITILFIFFFQMTRVVVSNLQHSLPRRKTPKMTCTCGQACYQVTMLGGTGPALRGQAVIGIPGTLVLQYRPWRVWIKDIILWPPIIPALCQRLLVSLEFNLLRAFPFQITRALFHRTLVQRISAERCVQLALIRTNTFISIFFIKILKDPSNPGLNDRRHANQTHWSHTENVLNVIIKSNHRKNPCE